MKIIAVRHEQTDYNKKGMIQGVTDIALNEEGINNCKKLKEKLEKFKIDFVITSPLKRAIQTAYLISDAPLFIDERLKERTIGFYEGKDATFYDSDKYADYNKNSTENGVESIRDVLDRIFDFLDEIVKMDEKTILLVSHGGIIKLMPYYFLGIPKDSVLNEYKIENGEYFIFER